MYFCHTYLVTIWYVPSHVSILNRHFSLNAATLKTQNPFMDGRCSKTEASFYKSLWSVDWRVRSTMWRGTVAPRAIRERERGWGRVGGRWVTSDFFFWVLLSKHHKCKIETRIVDNELSWNALTKLLSKMQ